MIDVSSIDVILSLALYCMRTLADVVSKMVTQLAPAPSRSQLVRVVRAMVRAPARCVVAFNAQICLRMHLCHLGNRSFSTRTDSSQSICFSRMGNIHISTVLRVAFPVVVSLHLQATWHCCTSPRPSTVAAVLFASTHFVLLYSCRLRSLRWTACCTGRPALAAYLAARIHVWAVCKPGLQKESVTIPPSCKFSPSAFGKTLWKPRIAPTVYTYMLLRSLVLQNGVLRSRGNTQIHK